MSDRPTTEPFDIDYKGWTPCTHSEEKANKVRDWIIATVPERLRQDLPAQWQGLRGVSWK